MSPKQKKKLANALALILLTFLGKKEGEKITIGQIRQLLMSPPYNMSFEEAKGEIDELRGIETTGDGDDAVISSIKLETLTPADKRVLSLNFFRIKDFLSEPILGQIRKLTNPQRVGAVVWMMDHIGYWVFQDHIYGMKKGIGLSEAQISSAISQAATVKHYIDKPDKQKGAEVILAPGKKVPPGIDELIKLYDKDFKKLLKKSKTKEFVIQADVHTNNVSVSAEMEENHCIIDIISKEESVSDVEKAVRDFISELLKV